MKDKILALRSLLNVHFLICFGLGWMATNGWAYLFLLAGILCRNTVWSAVASGYLAFLWLPFTPEKIITVMIASLLMKMLFPRDFETVDGLLGRVAAEWRSHTERGDSSMGKTKL